MKTIKNNPLTEKTTVEEILKVPGAEKILTKYQLPCLHCPMAEYELAQLKIGEVAKVYGLDLKSLLKELNSLVQRTGK